MLQHHQRVVCGFTLVELLVVVAIIMLLAALLWPGLKNARLNAKRAVCVSNLRQVGFAQTTYQGDWRGFVPMYVRLSDWRSMLLTYTSGSIAIFNCPAASRAIAWSGETDATVALRGSIGVMFEVPYNYQHAPICGGPGPDSCYTSCEECTAWPTSPGTAWRNPETSLYCADAYTDWDLLPLDPPRSSQPEELLFWGTDHIHGLDPGFASYAPARRFADRHRGVNTAFLDGHVETYVIQKLYAMVWQSPDCVWDVY